MNEELKPCPFCGGKVRILVGDEEGNIHPEEYEDDPWSGLGYQIAHSENDMIGNCPIAKFEIDGGTMGMFNYATREEAIRAWNNRVKDNYNSVDIKIGDKKFCVINDYPKYIVKEGVCKKISKYNDHSTKYTFKMNNYKTYTFTESSFGKKVFEDNKSAENAAKKLNKE